MRRPVVLIVDDEPALRKTLEILLRDSYETISVSDGHQAVETVRSRPVDMILLDVNLPGVDGLETLKRIRELDNDAGVIMISGTDKAQKAVAALKMGAYDYITKPFDNDDLLLTLDRCVIRQRLKDTVDFLKCELEEKTGLNEMVSVAANMRRVFGLIEKVAATSSNVLISGESGTGKELVARAIQAKGQRKAKPFVAVNCGAVPTELMESELFGHEKGSFTGAHARKIGKFEYADGGTVFFDEVSTLPASLQIKLLRVLQEKTFERVGGNVPIKVDIRVIAATNADLAEEVKKGSFREDLLYRLNVVPIKLPPLRERKEDIPVLVKHFVSKHAKKCSKSVTGIEPEAVDALCEYSWPGNVRELENMIERLVVLARDNGPITYEDLPAGKFLSFMENSTSQTEMDFKEACRAFERHYITGVLNKTGWNRGEAADVMNVHRNTLLLKMKELGIVEPERKRA
ncbi:MAG: sigma-54-dependent Fis family transcriptional regulator [Deltaproteobacteria bacterium]|nr:sigma-54-dependent Fis family transcriptional regulator [Deltaproteobacteria bacterium]